MAYQHNKPKLSKSEVSQTFNLKELLGREVTDRDIREFADKAVEHIVDRTQSGKTINNTNFRRYTKEYAEFKGVDQTDVDMTFNEEMLNAFYQEKVRKNSVKISLGDNDVETKKAYNHNVGDTLPKRPFFGLNKKEALDLARQFKKPTKRKPKKETEEEKLTEPRTFTVAELLELAGGLEKVIDIGV